MKKNGPPNVPRKKVCISIGNLDLFAYSIFKNREILSDQGLSTRNKLIFEFSLVFPMLKIHIEAIVFSMKESLLLFHDIIYIRVWSTFSSKI